MKAVPSPDGRTFTMGSAPGWTGTYPVEDLPAQIAFYRGLRDRKEGRYARHYASTVMALEALQRELMRRADRAA